METGDRRSVDVVDVLVALALMAAATALRAWHARWGLPDFTEEAIPLQLSFRMRSLATGAIDPNPHAFSYPSLGIYLHLLVQQCAYFAGLLRGAWANAADYQLAFYVDPTPMVLAARSVGIACDTLAVLAAWRIGRRYSRTAGIVAGLLIVLATTSITTARSIYVDSVMACLGMWAIERMLAWHVDGGRGRFVAAAVLVGLAAGAKYPAAVLLLPLGALALMRNGRRGLGLAGLGAGIAVLAFVLTTPFALLDAPAFLRDFRFEGHHAAEGHLGSEGHRSFAFHLGHLARDLGWPAFLILALSPLVLLRDVRQRPAALALWMTLLAFGLPIALARIDAERYLLPVLFAAAPLVALATAVLLTHVPSRLRGAATVAALILVLAPVFAAGVGAARRGARDTQVDARRWCESHLTTTQLVVSEGYGPRLVDEKMVADLRDQPAYRYASPAWRTRVDRITAFHVVALPMAVTGRLVNELALPGRPPTTIEIAPHASAISNMYYVPALFSGADWFITTGAVRGRYAADATRFAGPCGLYRLLDATAPVATRFAPTADASGPEIVIYRIDDRVRAALEATGPLDPLWWTAAIPSEYRLHSVWLLAGSPPMTSATVDTSARRSNGEPSPWVLSLLPLYQRHIANFADEMARSLSMVGRFEDAARFAEANNTMMPKDVPSCLLVSATLGRTHRWPAARAAIERTLETLPPREIEPLLTLQYARALAHTGEPARAREMTRLLVTSLTPGDPVAIAAKADLARMR